MRARLSVIALSIAMVSALILVSAAPVSAKANLGSVIAAPKSINFGQWPANDDYVSVWMYNNTKAALYLYDYSFEGKDSDDFQWDTGTPNDCYWYYTYWEPLYPGESCGWLLYFSPDELGAHNATFWNYWWDGARDYYSWVGLKGFAAYWPD